MNLMRGMRDKLEKYINIGSPFEVTMHTNCASSCRYFCFGVDSSNRLTDEKYLIFDKRKFSPKNGITYTGEGNNAKFGINLPLIPPEVNKIVFVVSLDGSGTMGNIVSHDLTVSQNGSTPIAFSLSGSDFQREKAVVTVEIYRKDVWRIAAIAMGFNGGFSDLIKSFGREKVDLNPPQPMPPIETPKPQPAPSAGNHQPTRISLRKGEKVSLVKKLGGDLGEILINLNWSQPKGIFAKPIDLDLGCLYELKDGRKGTVQALGNCFGSLDRPPYIALDGDDRTGASQDGENIRINGKMVSKIKRVLVYTFIYDGVANWKSADGVVTVKCPGNPDIIVKMDEYGSRYTLCAIALIENVNDTLSVQKIVNFYRNQRYADEAFHWGLKWVAGTKD